MRDIERLEHYRDMSPVQRAAKRHQLLKDGLMFRALKKQTGNKRYDDLADTCFLQYGQLARVIRDSEGVSDA